MTIVLTPYWSNGVQKLKMAPQGLFAFSLSLSCILIYTPAAPPKPAHGLTPPTLEDSVHAERCMKQFRGKDKDIEKYIYLSALKEQDPHMFYRLCLSHMSEFTPIIYTPTVGQACQEYSHNYRRPEGLFVSVKDKGKIRSVLRAWPKMDDARISVVTDGAFFSLPLPRLPSARFCTATRILYIHETDITHLTGSRILGLGDLGINGMPISIGKLSLYIAGAGCVGISFFLLIPP